jgi:DNA mismatch endonuclease Vsr
MADKFSKEKRSSVMRAVKHKDTLPELIIQSLIRDMGVTYECECRVFHTKPDIIIVDMKKVFFINGCFWHGHTCKRGTLPVSNHTYWQNKIEKTKIRDNKNYAELTENGWNYLVIWECEIKKKNMDILVDKISNFLTDWNSVQFQRTTQMETSVPSIEYHP